ncbi:MAG: NAD(P)/FAD-dependent oxidoreductase [Anaerovoracaceae bacterium]
MPGTIRARLAIRHMKIDLRSLNMRTDVPTGSAPGRPTSSCWSKGPNHRFSRQPRRYYDIDLDLLAKTLKDWKFEIIGFVGYERCVITAGGISTDEVVPKTMESRVKPGLYLCGEVLDMDCDTGGYNLQCAFSTGYLAGESAAKSLNIPGQY